MKRLAVIVCLFACLPCWGQIVYQPQWYDAGTYIYPQNNTGVAIYDPGQSLTMNVYDATPTTGATVFQIKAGAGQTMSATLGSGLVTNGTFTGSLTGWTVSGTGLGWTYSSDKALHGAGNTETLSQSISVINGSTYQIEFTIAGRTAGSIGVALGAVSLINSGDDATFTTSATYQRTLVAGATGSVAFTITPTSYFDGSVDTVTVKAVTLGSVPALWVLRNNNNDIIAEARANYSLANIALGYSAGRSNTTGSNGTNVGYQAGYSNTTGSYGTNVGVNAGYSNTTGSYGTNVGVNAGYSNTTGNYGTSVGVNAGRSNTTGSYGTNVGVNAGYSNTTGSYGTNVGAYAGYSNTTGSSGTNVGYNAGYSNTTGGSGTNVGHSAGYSNTTGINGTNVGVNAGYANTTGINGTNVGASAGRSNTTGSNGTNVGANAGRYLSDGTTGNETSSNGLYLGYDTRSAAAGQTNEIVIGASAIGNGSNTVTLGNTSVATTVLRGNVLVGTTTAPTGTATKVIVLGDNTAEPTMGSNTAGIYAMDVSGTVEVYAVDEAGNEALLTNAYESQADLTYATDPLGNIPTGMVKRNPYLGIEQQIDMLKLARLVEQLTGEKLVTVREIPKRDWDAIESERVAETDAEIASVTASKQAAEAKIIELSASTDPNDVAECARLTEAVAKIEIPARYKAQPKPKWMADVEAKAAAAKEK